MLIRIRRLAGSVVGAAFILLLAISLLGTGNSVNPMAFFQGSPVVIEVGDQTQRWNTLDATNAAANAPGLVAADYAELGYGSLITAMAVRDSWDQGRLSLNASWTNAIGIALQRQQVFVTPDIRDDAVRLVTPLIAATSALRLVTDDSSALLPVTLQDVPAAQVTQAYDFESIRVSSNGLDLEDPSDDDLRTTIEDNPDLFVRPDTWAIDALIVDVPTLADRLEVTDDQVRQFYIDNPDLFSSEEAWDLQTLTFLTQLEATLFQSQIDQGATIDEAITNSTATVTNAGLRPENRLSAEELELSQTLSVGDLSAPTSAEDGSQTYSYFKAYQPVTTPTLDEVWEEAEAALKDEQAEAQLTETIQALQRQARQEDLTLGELADKNDYTLESFSELQSANTAPAPINVAALFDRLEANRAERAIPSRVSLIPGEIEMLFTITAFEDSRPQTFEEAREEAEVVWRDQEALAEAAARTQDLAARWRDGEDVRASLEALDDPFIDLDRVEAISRLNADLDESELGSFLNTLDQTAQARLIGRPRSARQVTLIEENPRLLSPFALPDQEIVTINLPDGFQLLRATYAEPQAPEGDEEEVEEEAPREALVESLIDGSAAALLDQLLLTAYLDDVAATRPATVDSDAIVAENLARQQALAQHGGL